MEDKIKQLLSRKIDVNCGNGVAYRGIAETIEDGVLTLKDESDAIIYISVKHVIVVTECIEPAIRPGFLG